MNSIRPHNLLVRVRDASGTEQLYSLVIIAYEFSILTYPYKINHAVITRNHEMLFSSALNFVVTYA